MNDGLKYILAKVLNEKHLINEATYAQIRAELDHQYAINQVSRHRYFTKLLQELEGFPSFVGIKLKKTDEGEYLLVAEYEYRYTNSEGKRVHYVVTIEFKEFSQILDNLNDTLRVKVKALFNGELGVHCSCKSFRYRYNYVAGTKNSAIEFEPRPANVTNPHKIGIGCKHIHLCMDSRVFKFIYNDVYSFLNRMFTDAKKEAMSKDPTLKGVVDKDNNDKNQQNSIKKPQEANDDTDSDREL